MNQGCFTFKTAVDWVELEIQLAERSNFWTVQDALIAALRHACNANLYVNALDETSGRAASIFRFRIQDLKQMRRLDQALSDLRRRFDIVAVRVVAIEIAFDTYCEGASVRQLAEIATERYRFLTTAPGDDWYFYRNQGEGRRYIETLDRRLDLVRYFEDQWQLTDRNTKDAEVRFHAYVKTRDGDSELLLKDYRARLEITLQGAELPCTTVEELAGFNFAKLAKHFKFRRFAEVLPQIVRHPLMVWSKQQHGRSGKYRRPNRRRFGTYSGTSVFKCSTVADEELNAAVYECLRKLTRDWRSKRISADFPEHSVRETSTNTGNP